MQFATKAKIIGIEFFLLAAISIFLPNWCLAQHDAIDFNRDIRPILSDNCFKCHGPDEADRHADLRLDNQAGIDNASELIEAGDSVNSELLRRIATDDESELMPPADSGRVLSDRQKRLIQQWIDEGAQWEKHWSLIKPTKPDIPAVDDQDWMSNEIDAFVLRRLEQIKLIPNESADRNTLIRRLCLDLTGLPPDHELFKEFRDSKSEKWYEELVERLLDSPHYGEHMARFWLDAARYADTHGLHLDNYREMWLYRDWVVNAFNENKPYKDFVVEQLAGDLLDDPTEDQLIATGFNRAHVTTNEGGSILEEILVRNVVDRVSTTGTVFMGLTIGCAQCHDHKYDPITQKDFYSMFAFFNSLDANPMDGNIKDHAPVHRHFDAQQRHQLDEWNREHDQIAVDIDRAISEFDYVDDGNQLITVADEEKVDVVPADYVWFDDELPTTAKKTGEWKSSGSKTHSAFSGKTSFTNNNDEFTQMYILEATPKLRFDSNDTLFTHVFLDPENPPKQLMLQFNDGSWEHRAYWGENLIEFGQDKTPSRIRLGDLPETGKWVRLEVPANEIGFNSITAINGVAFSQFGGSVDWDATGVATVIPQSYQGDSLIAWKQFQQQTKATDLPEGVRKKLLDKNLDESGEAELRSYFLKNVHSVSSKLVSEQIRTKKELAKKIKEKTDAAPTTLIWKEKAKPVDAYVLTRGEYDQRGETVARQTPVALPVFADELTKDRLGLAKWLVSEEHPLTARVAVNRFWQQFFGTGIVATSEDFGSQGELPSHPELLDWLTVDFVESDWDVKQLVRKIVTSSTYRQSAAATPEKIELDDGNRYFSRGPRYRLDAETLRDQALSISGLLVPTIGGPAVKPPQPDGLWFAVGYTRSNTVRFEKDKGAEKVYRRSLYTFWKRTAPPPQMSTFDAPSRESCIVRRERTNTPLQALLLLNDPQYIEAARNLAQRIIEAKLPDLESRIRFMYERAMCSDIPKPSLEVLKESFRSSREEFQKNPDGARDLIAIGETPPDANHDPVELAALTLLANLIMNQDSFVSKN